MTAFVATPIDMTLAEPWMLSWLFLLPVSLWIMSRNQRVAVLFGAAVLLPPDKPHVGSWRQRLAKVPLFLRIVGPFFMILALARPVVLEALPRANEGIDIVLCMDVSSSMKTKDMSDSTSRIDIVRSRAEAFIQGRPNDRIALVAFARYADLVCPLTLDHWALIEILMNVPLVDAESVEDATGIGLALAKSATLLPTEGTSARIVVLLTDGVENVSSSATPDEIAPIHAAQLCQNLGIRVHTIVAGRGITGGDGKLHAINTEQVELVAKKTRGTFFSASDGLALERVFDAIDQMEKSSVEEPRFFVRDMHMWFVVIGLSLLLIARFLRSSPLEISP